MNPLYIQEIRINWDEISPRSYLQNIPALRGMVTLPFTNNVTFFVGENGTGKSPFWKQLLLAMASTRRVEP